MIVCIKCNRETKEKLDRLLKKDNYKDYSELIAIAIDNLWILDHEVSEKGALVIGEDPASASMPIARPPIEQSKPVSVGKPLPAPSCQTNGANAPFAPIAQFPVHIPELFLADGLDQLSATIVDLPPFENAKESYTLDRWIFGQYNKLLPAKVNCRALVRFIARQENAALLDTVAAQIAEAATLLGDYLADYDRCHQLGRDDSLATAFPRSGPEAEKSRIRYANQFVGSVNSQGILSGLLCDYRLAALAPGTSARLLPTEPAVNFARLINPVLDTCQTEHAQKFSLEEIGFILEHIRSHVPVEAFAFRTLIQAIMGGADTPDKLDEALRTLVPTDFNRSLSPSFLTSQRSGALSRMADLGLITRIRKGVRVTYTITPNGEAFVIAQGNDEKKENS